MLVWYVTGSRGKISENASPRLKIRSFQMLLWHLSLSWLVMCIYWYLFHIFWFCLLHICYRWVVLREWISQTSKGKPVVWDVMKSLRTKHIDDCEFNRDLSKWRQYNFMLEINDNMLVSHVKIKGKICKSSIAVAYL